LRFSSVEAPENRAAGACGIEEKEREARRIVKRQDVVFVEGIDTSQSQVTAGDRRRTARKRFLSFAGVSAKV
jgi:hypothetical protein